LLQVVQALILWPAKIAADIKIFFIVYRFIFVR
jgi:hypothetical protein